MNWVDEFGWLLVTGGVVVFLVATVIGVVLQGRKAAEREDERQRQLALAIEEERRSEEREAARQRAFDHIPLIVTADLATVLRQYEPIEVNPPTSRSYIEQWCICTHSSGWHSKYGCEAKDCACNWRGDE